MSLCIEQALWPGPCRPIRQFLHCRCNGTSCKIHCIHGPGALLYTTIAGACLARLKHCGTRAEHEMRSSLPDGTARPRSEGLQQRSNNLFWTNLHNYKKSTYGFTAQVLSDFSPHPRHGNQIRTRIRLRCVRDSTSLPYRQQPCLKHVAQRIHV